MAGVYGKAGGRGGARSLEGVGSPQKYPCMAQCVVLLTKGAVELVALPASCIHVTLCM